LTQEPLEFEPYADHDPACAVVAVTPPEQAFMHAYYDICPQSPSGRYLACLRLPYEDRDPGPDDAAEVCVIDLPARTLRVVYRTTAWGFQTAAHQQWGRSDRYLYFNDKRGDVPFGVRLDLHTGRVRTFDGPIWQVHPDETFAITPCLIRANLTQPGYGVSVRPDSQRINTARAAEDDGMFRVDLHSGKCTLLVSLAQVWEALPDRDDLADAVLYGFHVKFNPRGTRILFVARARRSDGKFLPSLLTCRADGSELRTIVPHRLWRRGGHHPIWHPNGRQVLMNLTPGAEGMRFCLVDAETGELEVLAEDPPGTGHPSISPDGKRLLTDDTREAGGVRSVALRVVDLEAGTWKDLCRTTGPAMAHAPLRCDAHPVWDRSGRRFFFGAMPAGRRRLFLADPALPNGKMPEF